MQMKEQTNKMQTDQLSYEISYKHYMNLEKVMIKG